MLKCISHAMLPKANHDEQSRQDFVSSFRGHLSSKVMPGVYKVFKSRVEPFFLAKNGRLPANEQEVRKAMTVNPFYQFWSAMQRRSQEMLWEAVIDPTERQLPNLIKQAIPKENIGSNKTTRSKRIGTLRLDPTLNIPRYHTAVDIHLQPGGYHTDFTAHDVAAGAIYDKGINLYMGGALGPENNLMGDILLAYLREKHPKFKPNKILDMGCAIGNSTLIWGRAFNKAKVHGIDVGAPVLRYAHARAAALGVPIHFSQENAEHTNFALGSFDLIVSHIVLHETSRSALPRILGECHRLLRPGGLMLHLEIPRGKTLMEQLMHNWESFNNNETFARYMTHIDLQIEAIKGGFVKKFITVDEWFPDMDVGKMNYADNFFWKILAAERE